MTVLPLRFRNLEPERTLCVNDTGQFFTCSSSAFARLADRALALDEIGALRSQGHWLEPDDHLAQAAHKRAVARRMSSARQLDYLILVPTLRCNLACSYCQVSRADEHAPGHDWSDETLSAVLAALDNLETAQVKIEFQGGEPTLRPDLIKAVIDRTERFARRDFVICTNLQNLNDEILGLFDRPDVYISTSLDGAQATHQSRRTETSGATDQFFQNLRFVIDRYGPSKVSALPTIDAASPPAAEELIEAFSSFGLDSIFLRPINYQGFARKRHASSRSQPDDWRSYYERFVEALIERNWLDRSRVLEETYFSIALRRIFKPASERHVDLRNPNPMGVDYIVVDYDGTVYPTDESRMLTRARVIDLAIGDIRSGWASDKRAQLNSHSTNQFDPDCSRCAYQPYCGRDVIDDLARYGRIDIPRHETEFCRRHMHLFDFVFRLIYRNCDKVRYSLSKWLQLPGVPTSFGMALQ